MLLNHTMPFISDILKYKSVAIVGLEKNTGKTECLNYILRRMKGTGKCIALTSIGIDGEGIDQVTHTAKPEIELSEGMLFVTSEKHYLQKRLMAEILDISERRTSLGRLVTARAKSTGKVLLSGPTDTLWLQSLIAQLAQHGADITFADGALSRLSLASPAITEAMVLATGAALSGNIPELVKRTAFTHTLIGLEEVDNPLKSKLMNIESGVWAIDDADELHNLQISSALSIGSGSEQLFNYGTRIFVAGAVGSKLIDLLRMQKQAGSVELIIRDFSRAFVTPESYNAFVRKGGTLKVLQQSKLVAVCVNPTAPNGQRLNSKELVDSLQKVISTPVYDIRMIA